MGSLKVERWYPFFLGAVVTGAWAHWCAPPKEGIHDLFATAVSFAAIVVGFLATAMSIVLAAPDSPIMRQLRSSGYIVELVRYLREPFMVGLAVGSLCLAGYYTSDAVSRSQWFLGSLVFLLTMLMAGLLRIAMVFMSFLKTPPLQLAAIAQTPDAAIELASMIETPQDSSTRPRGRKST